MQRKFFTVPELARLLDVSDSRIRYAVEKLGVDIPRAGAVRMIPSEWLPAIRNQMQSYGPMGRKPKPRGQREMKPRERLTLSD